MTIIASEMLYFGAIVSLLNINLFVQVLFRNIGEKS